MPTVQPWHHNKNIFIVDYLLLYSVMKSRCKLPENGDYAETCSGYVTEEYIDCSIETYTVKQQKDTGKIRFMTYHLHISVTSANIIRVGGGKAVPWQARRGPEGSRRFRHPDFHDIRHMVVVSASRAGLYPQECSWYSFSLGDESTPGPWCGRKEICHWKIQWHHRESIPGPIIRVQLHKYW
jgi:hypothetical protein